MTAEPPTVPASGAASRGLALGALGVVFGDIGTSPLYALRECLVAERGIALTPDNVLGLLSLILWSLLLLVTFKYVLLLLRADNHGEGGLLALLALVGGTGPEAGRRSRFLLVLAMAGAALLYADAAITPAISVLSALEGLERFVSSASWMDSALPALAAVMVAGLFIVQRLGTAAVARVFGPVMFGWFAVIGLLGAISIARHPQVLAAIDPRYGAGFLLDNGWTGFTVLGTVFLVITGGEALYSDMGHFGRRPIRLAWFGLVLPALLLSYYGQGAHALAEPGGGASGLFFRLAPEWLTVPLVLLATAATLIASQAVITGAFTMSSQAMQLGLLPRIRVVHTSAETAGRIYVPIVNVLLCIASLVLILQFRSSGALAGAYGIAVAGAMLLTACFIYVVAVRLWSWPRPLAGLVSAVLVSATGAFFASTLLKLPGGGWIPAVAAIGLYLLMSTWQRGRELYESRARSELMAPGSLLADLRRKQIPRVPGTAVFLTRFTTGLPRMLLHNIRHNRVVHEQTWLLTVETADVPWVQGGRVRVQPLGEGLSRVRVRFGFMEYPDLPSALTEATPSVLRYDPAEVSFFLGHDTVVLDSRTAPLARWRRYLFAQLLRLSESAPAFFRLPAGRVIELGAQVKI